MKALSYRTRLFDLFVVVVSVLVASALVVSFHLNFLTATFLFFGMPTGYLLYRKPSNIRKVLISSVIFGLIWGFGFEYFAEFNNAWTWSDNTNLIFENGFFGLVSIDILVWYFLWVASIVSFYEYFIEYDFSRRISKRAIPIAITGIALSVLLVLVSKTFPAVLRLFPFTYLVMGISLCAVFAGILIRRPVLFSKSLAVAPYFTYLFFVFELTSVYAGLWSFPGQYIGEVRFGNLSFPFEEFFFWIVISSSVAVAYHEHGVDDEK